MGFCEGPALHLNEHELNLSIIILRQALVYLKKNFPSSEIDLVYLPSSLSIYQFAECQVRPAPLFIKGNNRNSSFSPKSSYNRSSAIRIKLREIAMDLGIRFSDTTEDLKEKARKHLLHGPRDPIHLNRKGYECFAEAIVNNLLEES